MRPFRMIRPLLRNECGATIIEFSIVAMVFFILLFGMIEYGMIMLTRVAIAGATVQAARVGSIGSPTGAGSEVDLGCSDRVDCVQKMVARKTRGLVDASSVKVTSTVVSSPTDAKPRKPDICTKPPGHPYDATDCTEFQPNDGVPGYQPTGDLTAAQLGQADDLVEIRVTYLWKVLFPLLKPFVGVDDSGYTTISSSVVVKNEPF